MTDRREEENIREEIRRSQAAPRRSSGKRVLTVVLALVVVLQWCTSPLSGHMLAQLEYRTDAALPAHLELPQETEEGGVRV